MFPGRCKLSNIYCRCPKLRHLQSIDFLLTSSIDILTANLTHSSISSVPTSNIHLHSCSCSMTLITHFRTQVAKQFSEFVYMHFLSSRAWDLGRKKNGEKGLSCATPVRNKYIYIYIIYNIYIYIIYLPRNQMSFGWKKPCFEGWDFKNRCRLGSSHTTLKLFANLNSKKNGESTPTKLLALMYGAMIEGTWFCSKL